MAKTLVSPLMSIVVLAIGCDRIFGGAFGNDAEEAGRRMQRIPSLLPPGELRVEVVWEPGEEGITHTRVMYASAHADCPPSIMDTICAETGRIRRSTGATVEAWCHGTPRSSTTPVEVCKDGHHLPSFVP